MWGPLNDHLPSQVVLGQWGRWCGWRGRLPLRGSCINLEMAFVGGLTGQVLRGKFRIGIETAVDQVQAARGCRFPSLPRQFTNSS